MLIFLSYTLFLEKHFLVQPTSFNLTDSKPLAEEN